MARLGHRLREEGHEVRLLASRARQAPGPEPEYTTFGTHHPKAQVLTRTWNPSARATLRDALRSFAPDVVHVRQFLWQLSPSIMPLLADVPTVYHVSHYKAICPTATKLLPTGARCTLAPGAVCASRGCVTWRTWPFAMTQLAMFERWSGVFDRIVVLSEAMKQMLEAEGLGPATVVPNAVRPRPERSRRSDVPLVTYAGRLARSKGVDVLIDAFARVCAVVTDARLLIAGDGPELASLRSMARAAGVYDRVEFSGHLARPEMEERLEVSWVHVVPSRWEEPFGNVVTESMARGVPVIGSAVGGIPEVLRDGADGVLVPPDDVQALADAIESLVTSPERADRMGRSAHARAHTSFGEQRLVQQMLHLFEGVVAGAT